MEQKPSETKGDLNLFKQMAHSMYFTKTGFNVQKYTISEFQNHLLTSDALNFEVNTVL